MYARFPALILFIAVVLSDEKDCTFEVKGKHYDLSPLSGKTATGDDSKISTYHYTVSVCKDMEEKCEDIMTGMKLNGVVYQMGGEPGQQSVCWDMLAKWDGVTAGPLDASSGKPDSDGLTLFFSNGDPCRGSPRKTKINLICSEDSIGRLTGYQDDNDSCLFIINFETLYACSGPPPTTTPEPAEPEIIGTYDGVLSCVSPKCTLSPSTVQVTISGDCHYMVAFVPSPEGDSEMWHFFFDTCAGDFGKGIVKPETADAFPGPLRFDAFQSSGGYDASLKIIMYEDNAPYSEIMKLNANRVDYSTTPQHETTPLPDINWGINGTFLGHFQMKNGSHVDVTIQGGCDNMAVVMTAPDMGTAVWHVSFDFCAGEMASGSLKNKTPGTLSPFKFEVFLLPQRNSQSSDEIQIIAYDFRPPYEMVATFNATKMRDASKDIHMLN